MTESGVDERLVTDALLEGALRSKALPFRDATRYWLNGPSRFCRPSVQP
jgi:hypothetical protein